MCSLVHKWGKFFGWKKDGEQTIWAPDMRKIVEMELAERHERTNAKVLIYCTYTLFNERL